ncbi:MAG: hypothetical protein IPJ19_00815 [Planctomycetes bacterium]|nr:hypothetical protein [Planctomycetota bacterium]
MIRICSLVLALCAPALPLQADVLVVDPAGGSGVYTQIQAAVDAAQEGDVVLVRAGVYDSFAVNSKSLSVVGATDGSVSVQGGVRVRASLAGGTVLLANLSATGIPNTGFSSFGLWCSDNQGSVRIEHCSFTGASSTGPPFSAFSGWAGARVSLSQSVSFVDTLLTGGVGYPSDGFDVGVSGPGLEASNASVSLYDCTLQGGRGADNSAGYPDAGGGGDGCYASGSTLFFSGCALQGGDGGFASGQFVIVYAVGGDGGDGLDLWNSLARIQDSTTLGGDLGLGFQGFDGDNGFARRGAAPQFIDLAPPAVHASLPTPVPEGTNPELQIHGQPGAHAYLLMESTPAFTLATQALGMRLVANSQPSPMLFLGDIPASGTLITRIRQSALPAQVLSRTIYTQVLLEDASGARVYGPTGSMLVLDSMF